MLLMPWIIPVLLSLIVIIGYVANYRYLFAVARKLKNGDVFSQVDAQKAATRLVWVKNLEGDRLEGETLRSALVALTEYAQEFKPNWIVGVHPGGRFLSTLLTERLNLSKRQCLYVGTNSKRNPTFVFEPDPAKVANRLQGKMLFVDDIVRTGNTLNSLKLYVQDLNFGGTFDLSTVEFACLALVVPEFAPGQLRFYPDWFCARTPNKLLHLPWTPFSRRVELAYSLRYRGLDHDTNLIEEYESLIRNFDSTLAVAKTYLNDAQDMVVKSLDEDQSSQDDEMLVVARRVVARRLAELAERVKARSSQFDETMDLVDLLAVADSPAEREAIAKHYEGIIRSSWGETQVVSAEAGTEDYFAAALRRTAPGL